VPFAIISISSPVDSNEINAAEGVGGVTAFLAKRNQYPIIEII
jgi:hypothetical protein